VDVPARAVGTGLQKQKIIDAFHGRPCETIRPFYWKTSQPLQGTVLEVGGFHLLFRLYRIHEMQTVVTDDRGVCQPVCHAA